MLDLILDLKICLALVLLTGLITGYFFTKASAKEEFKPTINKLKKDITHRGDEILQLDKNEVAAQDTISKLKEEIVVTKDRIKDNETTIKQVDEETTTLNIANKELDNRLQQNTAALENQMVKVNHLKAEIDGNTPDVITQRTTQQHADIQSLQTTLNEQKAPLDEIVDQHTDVLKSWTKVDESKLSLETTLKQTHLDIETATEEENTIEDIMREKISTLKDDSNTLLERIAHYKNALFSLK